MNYLGVDPGLTGAIAMYNDTSGVVSVWDMPAYDIEVAGKLRKAIDPSTLNLLFGSLQAKVCAVEKVHGIAGQSASAAFNFGFGVGLVHMAVLSHGIRLETVAPGRWKGDLKAPKDKKASRARASQLFPNYANLWPLAKHDGRAEAAMLAYWASENAK